MCVRDSSALRGIPFLARREEVKSERVGLHPSRSDPAFAPLTLASSGCSRSLDCCVFTCDYSEELDLPARLGDA
jgi:hypothetical protein